MNTSANYDRLWTRVVIALAVALSAYFVVAEWDGLVRLANWLIAGIAAAPDSLRALIEHYATTPFVQWLPSLIVGAAVGIWGTLQNRTQKRAAFVTPRPVEPSFGNAILHIIGGAVVGAISAQILAGTMRHCTEAADVSTGERIAGWGIAVVSSLILLLPYWTLTRRNQAEAATGSGYFQRPAFAYALIAPSLISLGIFLYYPSIQTLILSLYSRRFPLPQERFVCLKNYADLFADVQYQSSAFVTAFVTVCVVFLALALSLGIAVLASQKIRGAVVYRTLLIFPFALSPVVTGVIFLALFREGGSGLINFALDSLFGITPSWLRDPILARWVIVAAAVWNILGFNILFYIAGLQNVPKDLLEAAQIDGANPIQRFVSITFPLLSPYTFFLLITNVTYAFYGVYGAVDALTQGGPPLGPAGQFGGATNVLIYKLYEDAFTPGAPIGQAAAQALLLFLGVAALTVLQFRFVERRVTYGE
ncbi:MAG: sugar ABC transporter permease [Chloroflexota bacterium]|nr:sugar ABC transporter permease [Chloroflexota bacterium]